MDGWIREVLLIAATLALVLLNAFFVAAEFALVKVRSGKLGEMARREQLFAKTAQWMAHRLDRALAACQLGVTMASLGLGWIGEPAVARLLEPVFRAAGISSPVLIHSTGCQGSPAIGNPLDNADHPSSARHPNI